MELTGITLFKQIRLGEKENISFSLYKEKLIFTIQLLEYPIPAAPAAPAPAAAVRHKKRHIAISREPSLVSEIRWCQNDRKKSE